MRNLQRSIRMTFLFALLISSLSILGQEDDLRLVGSGIVQPILVQLADASSARLNIEAETTGTAQGFSEFCNNAAAMTAASRPISVDENAVCAENGVDYAELLIAHDVLAFVSHPEDDFLACLTSDDLNTLFAPSAQGRITSWAQLSPEADIAAEVETPSTAGTMGEHAAADLTEEAAAESTAQANEDTGYPDLEIALLLPPQNSLTYFSLDNNVEGVRLREDVTFAEVSTILETVNTTPGALGVVPLQAALDSELNVFILDINFDDAENGCQPPTVQNAEDRLYNAATPFLLYVNRNAQENLTDYLQFLTSDQAVEAISASGFSPASNEAVQNNQFILEGEDSQRAFTTDESEFIVPEFLIGEINIGGTPNAFDMANTVATALGTPNETTLTINLNLLGTNDGRAGLCQGEYAIIFLHESLNDETLNCEDEQATVEALSVPLGTQAAVLVGNAQDTFYSCLTIDNVFTIWGAEAANTITNWNQIDLPSVEAANDENATAGEATEEPQIAEMTLIGIQGGSVLSDILLTPPEGGPPLPIRPDMELNNDPLFRAAATANVAGGLTYMSWSDYERVLANQQENVKLISIDGGSGCIEPSVTTIQDGSYPLTQSTTLFADKSFLSDITIQSYLWALFTDENFNLYNRDDVVGFGFDELASIRDMLQVEFTLANQAAEASQQEAETTPEPSTEETPEAESTSEAAAS